ncbi:MAG: hypothetical protein HW390_1605 [Candidatus Brocadiaceae bacterium]|nr:hypothetical protein [Candidatus Brocadiaceae bacterium]
MSSLFLGSREAGEPSQPLFTYLNLQPILNLALTNYSEELKQKTGMEVAIEWFLIKSTYAEVQFLTAMTALEHLVCTYVEQQTELSTIFPKKTFESIIKPEISAALDRSLEILLEEAECDVKGEAYKKQVEAAKGKILEINHYPFKTNLETFLKTYKVSLDGIGWREIEQLVVVRNKIVHSGLYISKNVDQYLLWVACLRVYFQSFSCALKSGE